MNNCILSFTVCPKKVGKGSNQKNTSPRILVYEKIHFLDLPVLFITYGLVRDSKPLLKYNILSEGFYVLIVAVYMYIDEEKPKIWILQCKMCRRRTFLFGTE